MSEIRETLARSIIDAINRDEEFDRFGYIDASVLSSVSIDGRVNLLEAMDAVLADFLVVPRSDIQGLEYGCRKYPNEPAIPILGGLDAAQAKRLAGKDGGDIWQRPDLPWTSIPEDGEQ